MFSAPSLPALPIDIAPFYNVLLSSNFIRRQEEVLCLLSPPGEMNALRMIRCFLVLGELRSSAPLQEWIVDGENERNSRN